MAFRSRVVRVRLLLAGACSGNASMRIRSKLALSMLIPLAGVVTASVIYLDSKSSADQINLEHVNALDAAQAVHHAAKAVSEEALGYAASRSPEEKASYFEKLGLLRKQLAEYNHMALEPNERQMLEQVIAARDELTKQAGRLFSLREAGEIPQAEREAFHDYEASSEQLDAAVNELVRHERAEVREAQQIALATVEKLQALIAFSAVVMAALTILATVVLGRRIVRPLDTLRQAASDFGQGKLDAPLQLKADDEFTELAGAFNSMADHLRASLVQERAQLAYLDSIFGAMGEMLIVFGPGGHVASANDAACALLGYTEPELVGLLGSQLFGSEAYFQALRQGADGHTTREDLPIRAKDGREIPVALSVTSLVADGGNSLVCVARDISERQRFEARLQHQATHDTLTGLPNRSLLVDRLEQAIAHARRTENRFVVAFIDLDRFKWINDSMGHEAGDVLLKTVAERMQACLRDTDTLARIGGDEFVLLLQELKQSTDALPIVNRVAQSAALPVQLGEQELSVSCSVGCSCYPEDGTDAEELLKLADAAMYRAKESGRDNVQVYNAALRLQIDERIALEGALRRAMEQEAFEVHYQPQIDLRTGRLRGVEALVRWNDPEFGVVSPARFIPVAEECGLIIPLGEWVLRRACRDARVWQQEGLSPIRMAVNLSVQQLRRSGVEEMVERVLLDSGLEPERLALELTESMSMDDPERTIPLMHRLKALGVTLAIDDFGTGYSNMHYLKRFPIDKLKLDGSFVREITTDPGSLAIADAIISMAHRLNLKVVAEMTETEGQVVLLASRGCDIAQGYYFSKAVPADVCAELQRASPLPLPAALTSEPSPTLLVLDDDQNMHRLVDLLLQQESYPTLHALTTAEGYELMARHRVGVILCDQRLNAELGTDFLAQVKRLYPHTVRLLFSSARDFDTATAAINQGSVYRYLPKPLDKQELRSTIAEAFELYGRLSRRV